MRRDLVTALALAALLVSSSSRAEDAQRDATSEAGDGAEEAATSEVPPPPPTVARPERPDLVFVVDPKMGMETGVLGTESLGRLLFRYEEALPRGIFRDEATVPKKLAGMLTRGLKLLFLDAPLADVETTMIHEVFGHGSRARDVGQSASYKLSIPEPYCAILSPRSDCRSFTEDVTTESGQRDKDLAVTFGGIEANYMTAYVIDQHTVAMHGWMHHADLLVYLASKLTYYGSFTGSALERSGATGLAGDDVDHYVRLLQDRFNQFRPEDRVAMVHRLQTAYLWNYADPLFYFAIYGTMRTLATGERMVQAPLPESHGVRFLPMPRFSLTPFGAEHYLDLFVARGDVVADLYGRVGTSGLASYSGGGLHVHGLAPHPQVELGGDVDVWSQPDMPLEARNDYVRPTSFGASLAAYATARVFGSLGLTGKLAYKSSGFLMGQPLGDGPYGYLGVVVGAPHAQETAAP